MFARSMSGRERWTHVESLIPFVRHRMRPELAAIRGNLGLCLLLDQHARRYVVISGWDSREAMTASEGLVAPLRAEAAGSLDGSPDVQEWELAAWHVAGTLEPGMWASVTCGTAGPEGIDVVVEAFDSPGGAAGLRLAGGRATFLLVNRADGRVVTAAVFDSYRSLRAARAGRARLHDLSAAGVVTDRDGIREYELDVAEMTFPDPLQRRAP